MQNQTGAETGRRLPTVRNLDDWAFDADALASEVAEAAGRLRDAARSRRERAEAFDEAVRWLAEMPAKIEELVSVLKAARGDNDLTIQDNTLDWERPPEPPPVGPAPQWYPRPDRKDEDDRSPF